MNIELLRVSRCQSYWGVVTVYIVNPCSFFWGQSQNASKMDEPAVSKKPAMKRPATKKPAARTVCMALSGIERFLEFLKANEISDPRLKSTRAPPRGVLLFEQAFLNEGKFCLKTDER